MFHARLEYSSMSFRRQPLDEALATIAGLGFADRPRCPARCSDHIPYEQPSPPSTQIAITVRYLGLKVRWIDGDVGESRRRHLYANAYRVQPGGGLSLAAATGARRWCSISALSASRRLVSLDEDLDLRRRPNCPLPPSSRRGAWVRRTGPSLYSFHRSALTSDDQTSQPLDRTDVACVIDFMSIVASA